jgi:ribosome-associated protein
MNGQPTGEALLRLVATSLEDDKAEDLVVIDLTQKSSIADAMVIASGRSARQVSAMAEHLLERLKAAGLKGVVAEGMARGDWVLIDGGDVIVHIFRPEVRAFYNLEKMWGAPASPAHAAAEGAGTAALN